jgi:hypothetical protein
MSGIRTKRVPDRRERLLKALRDGNTRRNACALAGISDQTLANWMAEDLDLLDAVLLAEAQAEAFNVAALERGARKSWGAALAWLERRRGQDWGKVDRVEVIIRTEAQRIAESHDLDADELVRVAEEIAAGR